MRKHSRICFYKLFSCLEIRSPETKQILFCDIIIEGDFLQTCPLTFPPFEFWYSFRQTLALPKAEVHGEAPSSIVEQEHDRRLCLVTYKKT